MQTELRSALHTGWDAPPGARWQAGNRWSLTGKPPSVEMLRRPSVTGATLTNNGENPKQQLEWLGTLSHGSYL